MHTKHKQKNGMKKKVNDAKQTFISTNQSLIVVFLFLKKQ